MISRLKKHYEKVACLAAALAVLAGLGWSWRAEQSAARSTAPSVHAIPTGGDYVPAAIAPVAQGVAPWRKAPVQSAGAGWVYELFTPPVIYYNTVAKSFTVTPPDGAGPVTEAGFGLQLVAVRLEPYRLQLTGYFGSPGDYVAAFEVPAAAETLLARPGQRFEALGLALRSFDVRKVRVDRDEPLPVYEIAGQATLLDERTGAEVILDTRARKLTDVPLAVLQQPGRGRPRALREGDTWADGNVTYRVDRIQLEPAEVVVARLVPGLPVPEFRTLHPSAATPVARRPADAANSLPERNVANNGP